VLDDTADQFPIYKNGSSVKQPLFTGTQPITAAPVVHPYVRGGHIVVFGTGRLIDGDDRATTGTQRIYGIWDGGQTNANSYSLTPAKLHSLTLNSVTLTISGGTSTFVDTAGSKRGWYFDLTRTRERVVIDAVAATGIININSTIPPVSACSDNGDGLKYFLRPSTGLNAAATEAEGGGYLGRATTVDIDLSTNTLSSYSNRGVSGRRTATKREAILTQRQKDTGSTTTTNNVDVTYLSTGRIYWREVKDFNKTNP
jgi:Tfp pilus tip-associated adhesin PilY1